MATPRRGVRSTRKLRDWIVEQVESGKYPGLVWDDPPAKTMVRIPWKHAGKQDFRHEEDAGFFKAWAIFKNKYKQGEPLDPATWKTRMRCALTKSPEFEEVPKRSRLDLTEPYKVYRLVPGAEQHVGKPPKAQKSKKQKCSIMSLGKESGSLPEWSSGSNASTESHAPASSTYYPGEGSPRLGETAPEVITLLLNIETPLAVTSVETGTGDFSIRLSIFYSGELVETVWLPEGDCLITSKAAPPGATTNMRRVLLPHSNKVGNSTKQKATCQLLQELEKGVMVASNPEGIFIQVRGKTNIYWRGPSGSTPPGKLENNTFFQLFSTKTFQGELEKYQLNLAPHPEHQVTLCLGEEMGVTDSLDSKLIIVQIEQIFARRLRSSCNLPIEEVAPCLDSTLATPLQWTVAATNTC
ncbi:interferon regulatory factor 9 [Tiliqua scincoides]|uniref:interferon regulatory factor 9 n=1 Tax=Tiliqua scincoides TaxID=71010 RepID=UPI00346369BA